MRCKAPCDRVHMPHCEYGIFRDVFPLHAPTVMSQYVSCGSSSTICDLAGLFRSTPTNGNIERGQALRPCANTERTLDGFCRQSGMQWTARRQRVTTRVRSERPCFGPVGPVIVGRQGGAESRRIACCEHFGQQWERLVGAGSVAHQLVVGSVYVVMVVTMMPLVHGHGLRQI
jgi:hypothetical protein